MPSCLLRATGVLKLAVMGAAAETPQNRPSAGFAALWRFLPMLWPKGEAELKSHGAICRMKGQVPGCTGEEGKAVPG